MSLNSKNILIPVTKWNLYHAWPSISGLRYLIFHASSNGFSMCIRRIGRTVLIHEESFFKWIDLLNGKGVNANEK